MRPNPLPSVPIRHLLWSIPESFGGMTNVALHRATTFSEAAARKMEILTLAPDFDPRQRQHELRREGLIGKRVRIRNLWHELERIGDNELGRIVEAEETAISGDDSDVPRRSREPVRRYSGNGELLQTSRYRRNGRLLTTDRQDAEVPGQRGGRRITVYDGKGEPVAQWRTATALYHAWLDHVVGRDQSILICDSAFVGGLMHGYQRDQVALIQAIHSDHRDDEKDAAGGLSVGKFPILVNADFYDRVVLLTDRQRRDMLKDSLGSDNLVTVPNTFKGEPLDAIEPRPRGNGIVVSRLSGLKRIDHAIRAIASVDVVPPPTLEIYGEGDAEDSLASTIDALHVGDRAFLKGHDPAARDRFGTASFSLLTSRSEGQGLVLLESMAAGCIPIAYDIDYGPSDLITHEVDGFLVPAGDVDALAEAIRHVVSLNEDELHRIREAAVRRAREFSPRAIVELWGDVLTDALATKRPALESTGKAELVSTDVKGGRLLLTVRIAEIESEPADWSTLTWIGRNRDAYGRVSADVIDTDGHLLVKGDLPLERLKVGRSGYLDLFVDLKTGGSPVRLRIASSRVPMPVALDDCDLYATKYGNLSVRSRVEESS